MLTFAIRETNSHFTHGLKIIIEKLCKGRKESFFFLSAEHQDVADVVFMSLEEGWISADCYKIPQTTRTQGIILICRKQEHLKLMFRPCLYMLPVIFREDEVEEITRKISHWTEPSRRGKNARNVPAHVCHYCTTRHFTVTERTVLRHLASGHSLTDIACIMQIDEENVRQQRQIIMKKLNIRNQHTLTTFIRINLVFLMD